MDYCLPLQMTTFGQKNSIFMHGLKITIFQKGKWILESATVPLLIKKEEWTNSKSPLVAV